MILLARQLVDEGARVLGAERLRVALVAEEDAHVLLRALHFGL